MTNNIYSPENLEKARTAKSPEELLATAKAGGIEITIEEAKDYYEKLNRTGELSDDELDAVAGGKDDGLSDEEKQSITDAYNNGLPCPICGSELAYDNMYDCVSCTKRDCRAATRHCWA